MLDINNYDKNNNTCMWSALALGSMLEKIPYSLESLIFNNLPKLYNAFKIALDDKNFTDKEMQLEIQNYIASVINASLVNPNRNLLLSKEDLLNLYKLLADSFNKRGYTYSEGINAMTAIINSKKIFIIFKIFSFNIINK